MHCRRATFRRHGRQCRVMRFFHFKQLTMKEITKYVAIDGKEFYEKEKCLSYEDVIAEVAEIMRYFPPEPQNDGCAFANGGGYIQHKSGYFSKAKKELLKLARRFSEHDWLAN